MIEEKSSWHSRAADFFYWEVAGPIRWRSDDVRLYLWCFAVLRPFWGHCGDNFWGCHVVTFSWLNFLRGTLDLYYAVKGKQANELKFSLTDVQRILNMHRKYWTRENGTYHELKDRFNALIVRYENRIRDF